MQNDVYFGIFCLILGLNSSDLALRVNLNFILTN